MDRAGDELLAAARLSVDEHRRLGRGDAHDGRVELAHRGAAAHEIAEAVLGPEVDRRLLRLRERGEHGRPDAHAARRRQARRDDEDVPHERAVQAPEIAHPDAVVSRVELGVQARDGRVVDHQVCLRRRADDHRAIDDDGVGSGRRRLQVMRVHGRVSGASRGSDRVSVSGAGIAGQRSVRRLLAAVEPGFGTVVSGLTSSAVHCCPWAHVPPPARRARSV